MADPEGSSLARSSSRHRRQPSRFRRFVGRALSEWWVEILVVLLVAMGVFLLLERMQIRRTLLQWLQAGWASLLRLGGDAQRGLVSLIQRSTLSDLVGLGLLAVALAFILWRIRWRLVTMPRFTTRLCPRCGSELHRIHRRSLDRILDLLVPVRRYQCDDKECRWKGLRFGRGHQP
jgi:hypothetical protein